MEKVRENIMDKLNVLGSNKAVLKKMLSRLGAAAMKKLEEGLEPIDVGELQEELRALEEALREEEEKKKEQNKTKKRKRRPVADGEIFVPFFEAITAECARLSAEDKQLSFNIVTDVPENLDEHQLKSKVEELNNAKHGTHIASKFVFFCKGKLLTLYPTSQEASEFSPEMANKYKRFFRLMKDYPALLLCSKSPTSLLYFEKKLRLKFATVGVEEFAMMRNSRQVNIVGGVVPTVTPAAMDSKKDVKEYDFSVQHNFDALHEERDEFAFKYGTEDADNAETNPPPAKRVRVSQTPAAAAATEEGDSDTTDSLVRVMRKAGVASTGQQSPEPPTPIEQQPDGHRQQNNNDGCQPNDDDADELQVEFGEFGDMDMDVDMDNAEQ